MRALDPEAVEAVWQAVLAGLPAHPYPDPAHPLGCHRPRASDRACFDGILLRLVTGCSWQTTARLTGPSATTLRRRVDEWAAAGVFAAIEAEAIAAYDRIVGLDLSEVAIDGSLHKAPAGGQGTGPNPTDRGKLGWKWSIACDRWGIPVGAATAGSGRHDLTLLEPTLTTLADRALTDHIATLHLDRGYDTDTARNLCAAFGLTDTVIAAKRSSRHTSPGNSGLGLRWAVERTNSWLSNFGQLRRNTDRRTRHRHAQLSLAVTLIITVKLLDWAHRWSPPG
jgi:transposase